MYPHERCFHGFLLWTEVNDQCDKTAVDRRSYHEYVYFVPILPAYKWLPPFAADV